MCTAQFSLYGCSGRLLLLLLLLHAAAGGVGGGVGVVKGSG